MGREVGGEGAKGGGGHQRAPPLKTEQVGGGLGGWARKRALMRPSGALRWSRCTAWCVSLCISSPIQKLTLQLKREGYHVNLGKMCARNSASSCASGCLQVISDSLRKFLGYQRYSVTAWQQHYRRSPTEAQAGYAPWGHHPMQS